MDPITLILAALVAGASTATQDVTSQAVKDTYTALKERVQQHFAGKQQAEVALEGYIQDPDTWQKPLQKALEASHIQHDAGLLQHARYLLQQVQSQQIAEGKFITRIGTSYTTVIGEHNTINVQSDKE